MIELLDYKFRDGKFLFKTHGQSHKIGSKMFPVASPNKIRVFTKENTYPIYNEILANAINELTFEMGRCYTNSERILSLKKKLSLPLEFYAGWLFIGDGWPILHGWIVLGDNVIDMSLSRAEFEGQIDLARKYPNDPNIRERMASMLVEIKKKNLLRSEDGVLGQVFPEHVYVGCPDEKERASLSMFDIIKQFPNHPAPSLRNFNAQGLSPMQELMTKKGY